MTSVSLRKVRGPRRGARTPDTPLSVVQEELVYGALRRESLWKGLALAGMLFGAGGCIAAAVVALDKQVPAPALVPFDPATGMVLPQANVATVSLDNQSAVIQSMVYRYVLDRETFNQLDNDLRVASVMDRSAGRARDTMVALWSAENPDYPPTRYGADAHMEAQILSVTLVPGNRAQVRLRKRLVNQDGSTEGLFTVTLGYELRTSEARDLEAVWGNPHGFTVTDYSITSDRLEAP